jgi:hypothetical protein
MRSKFAVSIFLAGTLTFWLASRPVHASTSTASIAVTATVEAGCNVTPGTASIENGGSRQLNSAPTASVNCSLPVSYQMVVTGAPGNGAASLPRTQFAATPAYANPSSPELLKVWSLPYGVSPLMDEPLPALQDLSLSDSNAGSMEAARCTLFDAPPETLTLTIIY